MKKNIIILGSTGSIGENTLKVLKKDKKNYNIILLSTNKNINRILKQANEFNAKVVLDNGVSINIKQLISLISDAKYVIANDTGPAHIASHLKKNGLVLFGSHTTPKKVSIENSNFKAISVKNLNDLSVDFVLEKIKDNLN